MSSRVAALLGLSLVLLAVPASPARRGRSSDRNATATPAPGTAGDDVQALPAEDGDRPSAADDPAGVETGASSAELPPTATSVRASQYRVGPDDTLDIGVVGRPEFAAVATVTPRGTLVLPILNEVPVAGLTANEVQAKLLELLRDGYVRDAQVNVKITDYNNMKVWLFGFVEQPGERKLTGPTTILELLSDNLKGNASSTVTISRKRMSDLPGPDGKSVEEADTISVDLDALLRQGDLSRNVMLQNGDRIYVPSTSAKVGAFGEVNKPGFYPYQEGMTLTDLLELAGGTTEFANRKKIRIKRASLPSPIKVNLQAYYKQGDSESNVPLYDGDIVLVNSSLFF